MTTAFNSSAHLHWNKDTIRGLRKFLKLSQNAFSNQLGVRQQTVSEWETGVYEPRGASTTLLNMIAMSTGFNPSSAELLSQPQLQQPLVPETQETARSVAPVVIPGTRTYEGLFPPTAPSTQRRAEPIPSLATNHGTSHPSFSAPGGMSRREVPM
ncbi:MAG: helix-turn-helix domain-containing protein [Chloroflexi bacterium]|nr:helix-turn-helix domain-containing protein [Chloroflexota bacterium]